MGAGSAYWRKGTREMLLRDEICVGMMTLGSIEYRKPEAGGPYCVHCLVMPSLSKKPPPYTHSHSIYPRQNPSTHFSANSSLPSIDSVYLHILLWRVDRDAFPTRRFREKHLLLFFVLRGLRGGPRGGEGGLGGMETSPRKLTSVWV